MFRRDWDLRDLVSLDEWQVVQDLFAEALGLMMRTVSLHAKLLTKPSQPNPIYTKILPKPAHRFGFCGDCLFSAEAKEPIEIKEDANFKCPFGLDIFALPIRAVGKRIVAYVILGPLILNRRKDNAEYTLDAQRLGIDLSELLDALIEINVFSYNKIYSINKLVKETFTYMAQTGYHKKRLGEMAPEIRAMDPLFARYYEEKILNSLLNTCALALDADSGSVMTVDKKTKMLHVKAASKLNAEIISNIGIKMGEGIAGVAAATARPIILPQDEQSCGLSAKMKRRYIKSSMIVPFRRPFPKTENNDIYGVLNLNVVRKDVNFSQRDIALVQELINLVSIALVPFQNPHP